MAGQSFCRGGKQKNDMMSINERFSLNFFSGHVTITTRATVSVGCRWHSTSLKESFWQQTSSASRATNWFVEALWTCFFTPHTARCRAWNLTWCHLNVARIQAGNHCSSAPFNRDCKLFLSVSCFRSLFIRSSILVSMLLTVLISFLDHRRMTHNDQKISPIRIAETEDDDDDI